MGFKDEIKVPNIGILNLMPNKIETEKQFFTIFSEILIEVNLHFFRLETYIPKNCDIEYLKENYITFNDIDENFLDGLIITGAPLELKEFHQVKYWEELKSIMEFSKNNIKSTIYICWGALAGLYHHYNIPKNNVDNKIFGIFPHYIVRKDHKLLKGFDDEFLVPHSRYFSIHEKHIKRHENKLDILATNDEIGAFLIASKDLREIYLTGHFEYDRDTLKKEYKRDIILGKSINIPKNYFDDEVDEVPKMKWKAHRILFFTNWVLECLLRKGEYK